ncbi:kelch repeats protein [Aspergillus luchuensis]|uniref:Kelch repeats protein n=1 Tax=Aspergillus kawachii TaxID=1069201 RepID=A0A146F3L8_ASPKA|nr:kelch repeats protein [Aspergillus luchuensis]
MIQQSSDPDDGNVTMRPGSARKKQRSAGVTKYNRLDSPTELLDKMIGQKKSRKNQNPLLHRETWFWG